MTSNSEIVRIRSDDSLFIINNKTLNKFPNSVFFKIINNNESSDFVYRDGNTLYVDIKPENIKIIVDFMRGYKFNSVDESLKMDLVRLGFDDNNIISTNPNDTENFSKSIFFPNTQDNDTVSSISELSNYKIIRPRKERIGE
ncbi:hypothetical protein Catovirus_1_977 [Catovirus CTV1]|uniref:BTB domain-containing protein n=1 Tax=Catovirus CTV1 TaxID=1977631 RepID=A0A1V0SB38_9VIRU|nr:hypothetical protein Catovirus_1_977 [Catovirus CTV1]